MLKKGYASVVKKVHVCWICLLKDAHTVCLNGVQRRLAHISVWKALGIGDGELLTVCLCL